MKWNARYTKVDYAQGATRLKRVFAWLPVYISGYYIWLAHYEILQYYDIKTYTTTIEEKEMNFKQAQWINLSKRIIE